MNEEIEVIVDPFNGRASIQKIKKEIKTEIRASSGGSSSSPGGQVNSIVAGNNITVDSSDPVNPIVASTASGGISIGDTIGGTPANGGILYADGSDALKADRWTTTDTSYFGGAVTGVSLSQQVISDAPRFEVLNLSGVGQPNAMALATATDPFSFFMTDTDTLTSYVSFSINPGTPSSSNVTFGLAAGTSSNPEFALTTTSLALRVPIDMNTNKITELDTPTAGGDAVNKTYADAIIPSQTGNSGKFLTTNGSAVSWGTVTASPGGSNTQVQFNNSGAFGASSSLTWDGTRLKSNSGFRMNAGSSNTIGDSDGNGQIYFSDNSAHIYGYTYVKLRDGTGEYLQFDRARFVHGTRPVNNDPFGGGNFDAGAQLNEDISAYAGKGYGSVFSPRVSASANNDLIFGTLYNPELRATVGATTYTGLTKIALVIAPHNSGHDTIKMRAYASSAQNVDMAQWVDSAGALMSGVAKNGAFKPASLADSAAENNTVYYSTTASKLVYKDSGGTVNNLY